VRAVLRCPANCRAAELERPGDRFPDGRAGRHDFGGELKLSDGAAEAGGRRRQRFDFDCWRGARDGKFVVLLLLKKTKSADADSEAHNVVRRIEFEAAWRPRDGATVIRVADIRFAAVGVFHHLGLRPAFREERLGGPIKNGLDLRRITAGGPHRDGEIDDLTGPHGGRADAEFRRGGGAEWSAGVADGGADRFKGSDGNADFPLSVSTWKDGISIRCFFVTIAA